MIKFTTDGKKVTVIGPLNSGATIVREIYVTDDGTEVPSGEPFIANSLHDVPVVSFYDKKKQQLEEQINQLEKKLEQQRKAIMETGAKAVARVKALRMVASEAVSEPLSIIEDIVAGRITHIVTDFEYGKCYISEFGEKIICEDREYEPAIKLISLFGRSDGSLRWRIHNYSDGSGNTREMFPVKSLAEAREIAQSLFDASVEAWRAGKVSSPHHPKNYMDVNGKDNIPLNVPEDVTSYWHKVRSAASTDLIAKLEESLSKARSDKEKEDSEYHLELITRKHPH